jgi:hypothetical protein
MKTGQNPTFEITASAIIGCILMAGGATSVMLAMTLCALVLARPAIIKSAGLRLKACRVSTSENDPRA